MNDTREHLTAAWHYATGTPALYVAAAAVSVLALTLGARKIARHERPDDILANVAMFLGLGWSAEAVWELTGSDGADFPTGLRIALFAFGEVILLISMTRTKRSVREDGRAGRAGQTVWIISSAMAVIGTFAADSAGEGILRALVPLGLTLTWWQGVVPERAQRDAGAVTSRVTARRIGLWLRLIEPGENDVETVHRERLTQQLTRLEFKRRGATPDSRRHSWIESRLARLSLLADDDMIATVRGRVDRARWFTVTPITIHPIHFATGAGGGTPPANPAPATIIRTAANGTPRTAANGAANGAPSIAAKPTAKPAARPSANGRGSQHPLANDTNPSVRALARAFSKHPAKSNADLAKAARVSEGTANRYLPAIRAAQAAAAVNGNHPTLITKENPR
jgi:hypothetical protein